MMKYAKTIFNVASGNLLEMYDFMLYGLYAPYIAHALKQRKDFPS
jgi:hypothetical protein